jgi:hypothetical protein
VQAELAMGSAIEPGVSPSDTESAKKSAENRPAGGEIVAALVQIGAHAFLSEILGWGHSLGYCN